MMYLSRFRSLRIFSALAFSTVIFAIASPMETVDATQLSPIQSKTLFAEELSNASLGSAAFSSSPGEFRFINPIASNPIDPTADLDDALLPYLTVSVCRVAGSECIAVRSFNSQGPSAERLRIERKGGGSYFIVNWDVSRGSIDNLSVYRISVDAAGVDLGSVDLGPSIYKPFGRTWPIKFIVEKDAALRVQVFGASGMTLWEVADDLRTELGICDDQLRQLLLNNYPDATDEQVAEVVNGVCQDVELFPTTKIADRATRDALALFDMSTGRMVFAGDTTLLKNLRVNDVIVSRQSAAAPYGYLRKVSSIRKEKGMYTLETVQAKFTEAIKVGTLQVSGPLVPGDGTATARQSARSESLNGKTITASFDEGDQFTFTRHIEEEINLEGGDDEIGGTGTVKVIGDVDIKAGYNIGAGIEWCGIAPCADRLEAWMGFDQTSNLRIVGNFDGKVHKEFAYPIPMEPIFFMIGFLPVVLVPEVNVIVGVDGKAHIDFEFAAGSQVTMKPYLKWTDENGGTWQDLTQIDDPLKKTFTYANISGTIEMEVFAKLDASLLLYGAIGPSMDGSLGIGGTAQTGQSPLWTIFGHANVGIGLRSIFTELFDIGSPREALLDERFLIKEADRLGPVFSGVRTGRIPVDVGEPVYLGPRTSPQSFLGFYEVTDPDGSSIPNTVATINGVDIGLNPTFSTPGLRTVKITATDADNLSDSIFLAIDVRNSVPILTVTPTSGSVAAGNQFFVTARAYDPEDGFLPCSRISWAPVAAPDTRQVSSDPKSCKAVYVFDTPGPRNIQVTATDSFGATFGQNVAVDVGPSTGNRAPVIEMDSFKIYAQFGPRSTDCPIGILCEVPDDSLLFNGEAGDYHPPLRLEISVSDPEGDPFNIVWACQTGDQFAAITYNEDGSASCEPIYSPNNDRILVFAWIVTPGGVGSDGYTILATSPVHQYTMMQRSN